MEITLQKYEKMLVQMLSNHFDPRLHTLNYHLLNHTVKNTQRVGTLAVLHSSLYEHLDTHIN